MARIEILPPEAANRTKAFPDKLQRSRNFMAVQMDQIYQSPAFLIADLKRYLLITVRTFKRKESDKTEPGTHSLPSLFKSMRDHWLKVYRSK